MRTHPERNARLAPVWFWVPLILLPVLGCGPTDAELTQMAEERAELERLRSENKDLGKLRMQVQELERGRTGAQEVLKLRADFQKYQQLQRDYQKLAEQAEGLSNMVQQLQLAQRESVALREQNQQLQGALTQGREVAIANACVNSLRIIEGAKDQWALENKKPVGTLPTAENLKPYLKNNALPVCPNNGTYSLNPVGVTAICSIPTHRIPPQ